MKFLLITLVSFALTFSWATGPPVTPDPFPKAWKGRGVGKTYVLYRRHNVKAMNQGRAPSCTACSVAKALEILHGKKFSPEWVYGKSREHFGRTVGNGLRCSFAAQTIRDVGVVPAVNYPVLGFDLSGYDPGRAFAWERGPPETFDWIASGYKSGGFVKISTWEELRDAVGSGHPVIVGSTVGFGPRSGQVRDSRGRLHARWWSRWLHAQLVIGASDGRSKQALILNSWGPTWVTGPKFVGDEPDGSYWVSKRDMEKILRTGDSWAILPVIGLSR